MVKESSMKVGTACPLSFCSRDGDLKGMCRGDVVTTSVWLHGRSSCKLLERSLRNGFK